MSDSRSDLTKIITRLCPRDGLHAAPLPDIHCMKFSQSERRTKRHWHASVSLIVQGCKEIIVGRQVYRYDDEVHYIATPIDLPVTSRVISAAPGKPFLGIKIGFDPLALSEVANQLDRDLPRAAENPLRAVFMGKASVPMLEAALRLGKLFEHPDDVRVLGPLIVKEILYHLLKGPDGPAIRQFVRSGSTMHKISQAIFTLRSDLSDDVDVAALANAANMSRSAFFKHFKQATTMSPIQYQKRLRLLEARRLMTDDGETAEGSAFKVGYKSASQFSREYSRLFGNSPVRDRTNRKRTLDADFRLQGSYTPRAAP
jgi:AraC-like DNA-binding protein